MGMTQTTDWDTESTPPPGLRRRRPVEDRFWEKVEPTGFCWLWTATTCQAGYGRFWLDGRLEGAHRVAYELMVGPIPDGLHIDHLCRIPACVNPDHLEPVEPAENTRRGYVGLIPGKIRGDQQRAKTHCPHGHPFAGDNLYVSPRGHRTCKTCRRAIDRARSGRRRKRAGRIG